MASRRFSTTKHKQKVEIGTGAGNIGLTIDTSNFFRGFKLSQARLEELKLEVAEMTIGFYQKLILRTPVWRGTARMNWYYAVDGKVNRSGNRMGGANKKLVDPALDRIANKFGMGRGRSAKYFTTQDPELIGGYKTIRGRKMIGVGTQTQYGKMTPTVKKMVDSARNNLNRHFKVTGGGPRSSEVSKISITNKLPYIQYLEGGGSEFGEPYFASSVHKAWAEKIGNSPFVNPTGKPDTPHKDSMGSYRAGFIKNTFRNMQSEFTRFARRKGPNQYSLSGKYNKRNYSLDRK